MAVVSPTGNFYQYLDEDGDGTGNHEMTGDYSVTPKRFFIQPPAGRLIILFQVTVVLVSMGVFMPGGYGTGPALTNGVSFTIEAADTTVLRDFTNNQIVKTNGELVERTDTHELLEWAGADKWLICKWFFPANRDGITLTSDHNVGVTLSDDFTGLSGHRIFVKGTFT